MTPSDPPHGPDPIEDAGGLNLYAFCSNNAVNSWDVLGNAPHPAPGPQQWNLFEEGGYQSTGGGNSSVAGILQSAPVVHVDDGISEIALNSGSSAGGAASSGQTSANATKGDGGAPTDDGSDLLNSTGGTLTISTGSTDDTTNLTLNNTSGATLTDVGDLLASAGSPTNAAPNSAEPVMSGGATSGGVSTSTTNRSSNFLGTSTTLSLNSPGTFQIGLSGTGTAGGYLNGIAGLTFDKQGNVGLFYTKGSGLGAPASVDGGIFISTSNAASIYQYGGQTLDLSASGGVIVGGSLNLSLSSSGGGLDGNSVYWEFGGTLWAGTGASGSIGKGDTKVIPITWPTLDP